MHIMEEQDPLPLPYPQPFEQHQQSNHVFQQPQQPVMPYQPNINNGERIEGFRHKQSRVIGKLQIVIGILCVVLQSTCFGLMSTFSYIFLGYGINIGLMFISSGIACLVASNRKTKHTIAACMVLSIVSAASCGVLFYFGMIEAKGTNSDYDQAKLNGKCEDGGRYYTNTTRVYNIDTTSCPKMLAVVALQSLVVVLAIIEAALSIWESVICCKAVACCAKKKNTDGEVFIPQYMCSTQQISHADTAPFQQVLHYGYPNPAIYNQDPQSMPSGLQTPMTLSEPSDLQPGPHSMPSGLQTPMTYDPDAPMPWYPPPYEQQMQMQAPPPRGQAPPHLMQAQDRPLCTQDQSSPVLAPPGMQAPPPPQQPIDAPDEQDDAFC